MSRSTGCSRRAEGRYRHWLLGALTAGWLLAGCSADEPGAPTLALDGQTMGTYWSLRITNPPTGLREAALREAIESRLLEINAVLSTYDPDSELSRFNAADGEDWFEVSPELVVNVEAAQALSERTNGAFDVTVGPLVNLWGFGPSGSLEEVPTDADIRAAMERVGWQRLEIRSDPPALKKRGDLYVDLSAIAKGYAVDELAGLLETREVGHFLVDIGGELRARGLNPRGQPWRIGVEVPDPLTRGTARQALELSDTGIATSGDYRNFYERDGRRYSHTIDPATGRPVTHSVASVTVLHPSAMQADAWATALNVLGAERGLALAREQALPVLFILYGDEGPEEVSTPALATYRLDSNAEAAPAQRP